MSVLETERLDIGVSRPEIVLGYSERKFEFDEYFLVLPQIRQSLNRQVVDSMKESFRNGGDLIDCANSARIKDPEVLQGWLDLVERARGVRIPIEFCEPYRHEDGWYLVASGHHRHQAVKELNEESLLSDNPLAPLYRLGSDVTDVNSVEEIFALQKNGNNHTAPTKEEEASFTVMHYLSGLEAGRWTTKADFLRQNKEVNRKSLNDALYFADLPATIQDFVWTGQLLYTISVEVGRAYPYYAEYVMAKMGDNITPENKEDFETAVQMEMGILIHKLLGHGTKSNRKMTVLRAKEHINNSIRQKELTINKLRGVEAEENQEGLFPEGILYSAEHQANDYLEALRRDWRDALSGMHATSLERVEDCTKLMQAMVDAGAPPPAHRVEEVVEELALRRARAIGAGSLRAVAR